MKEKKLTLLLALWLSCLGVSAQSLTLEECHNLAMSQSPLQQKKLLLATVSELKNENLNASVLPQINLNGQVAWQSEVITFPQGPGLEFPEIPQTQYRVSLNADQVIYAGGAVRAGLAMNDIEQQVKQQEVEVEISKVKSVVNDLYFSVLLLDKNEGILLESVRQLKNRRKSLEAGVKYGVILKSNLDAFDKQVLVLEQKLDEIRANRRAVTRMLADWTGSENIAEADFILPDYDGSTMDGTREEYRLFSLLQQQLETGAGALKVRTLPKVSAFAMGGVGQPNPFNFLETALSPFLQVGLRASWTPWDWNQTRREKEILTVHEQIIETQKEQLDRAVNISIRNDQEKISSLEEQIKKDEEIISLQQGIVRQAESQLENGTITSADYLEEVTALTEAQLKLEAHRIEMSRSQVNILTQTGKL